MINEKPSWQLVLDVHDRFPPLEQEWTTYAIIFDEGVMMAAYAEACTMTRQSLLVSVHNHYHNARHGKATVIHKASWRSYDNGQVLHARSSLVQLMVINVRHVFRARTCARISE